jgi:hypothetical protein
LLELLFVLTHAPLHIISPAGQVLTHCPPLHASPFEQTFPHVPQFSAFVFRLVQTELQVL